MSAANDVSYTGVIGPVARALLGMPNSKHSSSREWRYGSHGSLAIDLTKDCWRDHESGVGGGVLDLIVRRHGGTTQEAHSWLAEFRGGQQRQSAPTMPPKPKLGPVIATYDYTDDLGEPLFQVCRHDPKTFTQRRPDPSTPSGWSSKLGDIRKPPFRLLDLQEAVALGRRIYVVEGEKAVLAMHALGRAATCNAGGAGGNARELPQHLAGANVVVLADNDLPGQHHASAIAAALHGGAASVQVLLLPGLPDKGDVVDWLDAGGTADQLDQLADAAPIYQPPSGFDEPPPGVAEDYEVSEDRAEPKPANDDGSFCAYRVVDPRDLHAKPVPERLWIVQDWLPVGHATADYGDGGTGKTLLAQQLMTSCATGAAWCGLAVTRCKVLGLFCEDDEDELHRRQDKINAATGLYFSDLEDMGWISGIGLDNLLMTFDHQGRGQLTDRFHEIERRAVDFGAKLVVIDTAADTFGGNENDRGQVRQFIGRALNHLAIAIAGAVLLNAHPSRTGLSVTGDMDGGSTAWSNTVRSRWSLARPRGSADEPVDTNERILTRRKANYAAIGDTIQLKWANGVLVPVQAMSGVLGAIVRQNTDDVFLRLLDRCTAAGQRLSDSKNAGNYAPKVFVRRPDAGGNSARDFEKAMHSLFAEGRLVMATYGRKGDRHRCMGPAGPDIDDDSEATVDASGPVAVS